MITEYCKRLIRASRVRPMCAVCLFFILLAEILSVSGLFAFSKYIEGIEEGRWMEVEGVIDNINVKEGAFGTQTVVRLKDAYHCQDGKKEKITGLTRYIQAYLGDASVAVPGRKIRIRGRVAYPEEATNPGQFDYAEYCYSKGIVLNIYNAEIVGYGKGFSRIRQGLEKIRHGGEEILAEYLDKEDAAIIKAMLFGNKSEISDETRELFKDNGISHILAISGLHISFLAMLLYRGMTGLKLPVPIRVVISEVAIIAYGVMIGFTPSAFRAICMFSIFLAAKALRRTYDMLTAMSVALTLVSVMRPNALKDVGLQLSFMAILGVGYFYYAFIRNIVKKEPAGRVLSALGVSAAVFICTLPILLRSYYEVAFYSILLNVIIIPLMSVLLGAALVLLMTGGAVSVCGIVMMKMLPYIPAGLIKAILWIYKNSCRLMETAGIGRANMGCPKLWQVVVFYAILLIAVNIRGKHRAAIFICLLILSLSVLTIRPHKGLDIWMLDVGQGDCMVLRERTHFYTRDHVYVIDCGSSSYDGVGEKRLIPMLKYYGIDRVDAVFITHPDADHINGILQLAAKAGDEGILLGNMYVYDGFYGDKALAGPGMDDLMPIHAGMEFEQGPLLMHVLHPYAGYPAYDANDASAVMDISYGDFHMLTTGDVEANGESSLIARQKESEYDYTVLKVAHHGSDSSSTEELLEWADPKIALISCGRDNPYGHPHKEVLDRLSGFGAKIIRTDRSGAIKLHTDGHEISVRTYSD